MATDASGVAPVAASAVTPQPQVSAEAGAQIDFSRSAVVTQADPDGKLKQLLSAQSAGAISRAASTGSLGAPLAVMSTASPFGYRVSPITGGTGDFHRGQDYAAQCGTSVMAAATGTVTFVGWHQFGGGNRVVIDHGNGLETTYNHLSSFNVKEGQTVSRGEVVALSGTTGPPRAATSTSKSRSTVKSLTPLAGFSQVTMNYQMILTCRDLNVTFTQNCCTV
jgi:murein DD-endopeptidase MepM/ murein hydrolase activator NlpD